jgi:hypothetical protein
MEAVPGGGMFAVMRQHLKNYLPHMLMCGAMLVVGAVLLASGTALGALVPLAGCVLMMAVMMSMMRGSDRG